MAKQVKLPSVIPASHVSVGLRTRYSTSCLASCVPEKAAKHSPRAWVLVLHREDPAGVPGSSPENEAFWVVNQLLEELSLDLPFSVTLPGREVSYSFKEIIKTQVNRKASQVRRLNIIKIGNNLSKFTLR